MNSFKLSLKQCLEFNLVIYNQASILCTPTILKYNSPFSPFLKPCLEYCFDPRPCKYLLCMCVFVSCCHLNPWSFWVYPSGIVQFIEPSSPSVNLITNATTVPWVLWSFLNPSLLLFNTLYPFLVILMLLWPLFLEHLMMSCAFFCYISMLPTS